MHSIHVPKIKILDLRLHFLYEGAIEAVGLEVRQRVVGLCRLRAGGLVGGNSFFLLAEGFQGMALGGEGGAVLGQRLKHRLERF